MKQLTTHFLTNRMVVPRELHRPKCVRGRTASRPLAKIKSVVRATVRERTPSGNLRSQPRMAGDRRRDRRRTKTGRLSLTAYFELRENNSGDVEVESRSVPTGKPHGIMLRQHSSGPLVSNSLLSSTRLADSVDLHERYWVVLQPFCSRRRTRTFMSKFGKGKSDFHVSPQAGDRGEHI